MNSKIKNGHVYRYDDNGNLIFMEDAIMEMRLGRKLTDNEEVVHKNGNPLDNRDANLELVVIRSLE